MTWPLRQSTASQEIPLGPFVDSTDGNTAETGLTIANTDIKLQKSGATSQTNKNSGGATHIATGDYYAVLDATDTDTVGPMRVKVHVAGALPVWLDCVVFEEAVYDDLFAANAGGYLKPTTAGRTLDVASTGEAGVDFDNILFSGNGPIAAFGVIDRGTAQAADANGITLRAGFSTAAANMVGKSVWVYSSTNGLHATGLITAYNNTSKVATITGLGEAPTGTVLYVVFATANGSAAAIADAVWDEATSGHTTSGTFGEQCATDIDAILVDTGTTLDGRIPAALVSGRMDSSVGAMAANTITAAATAADFGTEVAAAVLTAAAADPIDANVEQINTVAITGDGSGTPFGV